MFYNIYYIEIIFKEDTMKKIICLLLLVLTLVGCTPLKKPQSTYSDTESREYITGVWVSFSELDTWLLTGNFKAEFEKAIQNCKSHGITDMFVHTRAFCDAIYPSTLFPMRESASGYDFDVLEYMIAVCHQNGIKLHAWVNPYRVRTADTDTSALPAESPVTKWLSDDNPQNDTNVTLLDGIYLNPASSDVRQLILDGVREIISKYSVDGIHFDDYFYPTQDAAFDQALYEEYCAENSKPLRLDDWRRANVNTLISGCYTAIKFQSNDIVFSVSPSASPQENYNKHYADISLWVNSGCIDYIIPQLYFGFNYPDSSFRFNNLLNTWKELTEGKGAKLIIGLASYKINTAAEPDNIEWANGVEVINRQIKDCLNDQSVFGHIFFSYSSMVEYI